MHSQLLITIEPSREIEKGLSYWEFDAEFYRVKFGVFQKHWFGKIMRKKEKFELCSMVSVIIFK